MSIEYKVYVGDTPLIKADCVTDITNITVAQIKYQKPSGTTGYWEVTLPTGLIIDPNSGLGRYIQYQVQPDDFDESGTWKFQAYVVFSVGTTFHGNIATQTIFALFS